MIGLVDGALPLNGPEARPTALSKAERPASATLDSAMTRKQRPA